MSDDMVEIKKKKSDSMVSCSDGNHYPYGTTINFDNEMLDELGISELAIDDKVEIMGCAFVNGKSSYDSKDDSNKSMSFQLTSVKIRRKTEEKNNAEKLYGE